MLAKRLINNKGFVEVIQVGTQLHILDYPLCAHRFESSSEEHVKPDFDYCRLACSKNGDMSFGRTD